MTTETALKYDAEVKSDGRVTIDVPLAPGSKVTVFVVETSESQALKLQRLREDIQKGIDQLDRGEYSELSIDDLKGFFDDVRQRGREKLKAK